MRRFATEFALAGLLVLGAGCPKGEETGDTSDTSDTEDTNVPTEETDCDDGDDEDEDGAEDCEDSDCEGDPDCVFEIAGISAGGTFAYDATNDEITGAILGGTAIPPVISITIFNPDYQTTGADDDVCEIALVYNGTDPIQPENWDLNDGSYLGFIMPEGKYDVETNCESLNEETLGTVEQIAATGWGTAIGPESADITDLLDSAVDSGDLTADQRAAFFGGGFYWALDGVPEEFLNMSYANGFEVDADFNVLNADGEIAQSTDTELATIPSEDVFAGALPPTGFYQTTSASAWVFQ